MLWLIGRRSLVERRSWAAHLVHAKNFGVAPPVDRFAVEKSTEHGSLCEMKCVRFAAISEVA